jgi:agmatine deiminase
MTPRFPAEFEPHAATWIAWPHHEPDWPGKLEPIPWVYAEIARTLHRHERVEILCHDDDVKESARRTLDAHGVRENVRLPNVTAVTPLREHAAPRESAAKVTSARNCFGESGDIDHQGSK